MCNSNTSINAEAIAKEIANALNEMAESVVDNLSGGYDDECAPMLYFMDGEPVPFCPMTRKPCMGRMCAAAKCEACGKLATLNTGHVAEWKCGQYGTVVDWDGTQDGEGSDLITRIWHDLMCLEDELAEPKRFMESVKDDVLSIDLLHSLESAKRSAFTLKNAIESGEHDPIR